MLKRFVNFNLNLILRYYLLQWRLWKFNQRVNVEEVTLPLLITMAELNDLALLSAASPAVVKELEITSRFLNAVELVEWLDLLTLEIANERYITNNVNIMYVLKNEWTVRMNAFLYRGAKVVHADELQVQLLARYIKLHSTVNDLKSESYRKYVARIIKPLIREVITTQEALVYLALNYEKIKGHND